VVVVVACIGFVMSEALLWLLVNVAAVSKQRTTGP
jgi:hypothetical protein